MLMNDGRAVGSAQPLRSAATDVATRAAVRAAFMKIPVIDVRASVLGRRRVCHDPADPRPHDGA